MRDSVLESGDFVRGRGFFGGGGGTVGFGGAWTRVFVSLFVFIGEAEELRRLRLLLGLGGGSGLGRKSGGGGAAVVAVIRFGVAATAAEVAGFGGGHERGFR